MLADFSSEIGVLKNHVHRLSTGSQQHSAVLGDVSFAGSSENAQRIACLEAALQKLRLDKQSVSSDKFAYTTVFGNFGSAVPPAASAQAWVGEQCDQLCKVVPVDVYAKRGFSAV